MSCPANEHNYTDVPGSDFREYHKPDTINFRSFICTRCGDMIIRQISVWKNFEPRSKRDKLEK